MSSMRIGEVAKRSGIGIETIRYYERQGLLLESERRPSGYRQFDESTVERLGYIRQAKELGFTLAEIRELLELSFTQSNCSHIHQRAEDKISDIETKIRSLQQMKRALRKIVEHCKSNNLSADCPLVHTNKRREPK